MLEVAADREFHLAALVRRPARIAHAVVAAIEAAEADAEAGHRPAHPDVAAGQAVVADLQLRHALDPVAGLRVMKFTTPPGA